jgi:hypothetical protein
VGFADLASLDQIMNLSEVGIVAAVKADLKFDACLLYRRQRQVDPLEVQVDGLLTKDVLAGRRCLLDDPGVGVGGRTDDDRVDVLVAQNLMIICIGVWDGEPRRCFFGGLVLDIGNRQNAGVRNAICQVFRSGLRRLRRR